MIPLAAVSALPWKAIAQFVAVALAVLLLYLTVKRAWWDLPEARQAAETAQEALQRERDCAEGSECLKRTQAAQAQAEAASTVVLRGYEDEIKSLRDRPVTVRTVRVCPPVPDRNLRDASAPRPADGTGPGTGLGDGGTRPDIGPGLYALAGKCDEVTARLRGLQGWNAAMATAGK